MSWREDRLIHGKLDIGHHLRQTQWSYRVRQTKKESGRLGIQAFPLLLPENIHTVVLYT